MMVDVAAIAEWCHSISPVFGPARREGNGTVSTAVGIVMVMGDKRRELGIYEIDNPEDYISIVDRVGLVKSAVLHGLSAAGTSACDALASDLCHEKIRGAAEAYFQERSTEAIRRVNFKPMP